MVVKEQIMTEHIMYREQTGFNEEKKWSQCLSSEAHINLSQNYFIKEQ